MTDNKVNYVSSPKQEEVVSTTERKMPKPIIRVVFEGKKYNVDIKAYDTNLIGLPDGRVLQSTMWLESYPPQHGQLTVVETFDASKVIQATLVEE